QRRERGGKAAHPAASDGGTREKLSHLAGALKRLNKEAARRTAKAARQERRANATRAPALNEEAGAPSDEPSTGPAEDEGILAKTSAPYAAQPGQAWRGPPARQKYPR